MSSSDGDAVPDAALPDTAMASGSDAGEPGEHLGPADLAPDEQRLLAAMERDAASGRTGGAEDSVAAVRAAEDEAPLPGRGGAQDDGLSARFSEPGES